MLSRETGSSPDTSRLRPPRHTATGTTSQVSVSDSYDTYSQDGNENPQSLRGRVQRALETLPESQPTNRWRPPNTSRTLEQVLSITFSAFRTFVKDELCNPAKTDSRDTLGLDIGRNNTEDFSVGDSSLTP